MVGKIEIPVPIYSAIKIKGQRLYKKARRGESVEPPLREMEVRGFNLQQVKKEGECVSVVVRWDVGSGTYIRSLAEELGRRLGYPATIKGLRRTQIGEGKNIFRVENAEKLQI